MTPIKKELIKQIVEQLDFGFRCFIHKETAELITIPDESRHYGMEMDAWAEDMEKVDENFGDYYIIEPLESSYSFGIMEDFAYTIPESNNLRLRLLNALNQRKPFSKFKNLIDNSGPYRQHWFDFKEMKLQEYVEREIEALTSLEG